MAGTLSFKVGEVRKLLEHANGTNKHRVGVDILFNPKYHLGGKVKKKDGWPDNNNLDKSKIPAGLWLVSGSGVYLMSNGLPGLLKADGAKTNVVSYANECNPLDESQNFDELYDRQRKIMGGDDCTVTLFSNFIETCIKGKPDSGTFKLKVTAKGISFVG